MLAAMLVASRSCTHHRGACQGAGSGRGQWVDEHACIRTALRRPGGHLRGFREHAPLQSVRTKHGGCRAVLGTGECVLEPLHPLCGRALVPLDVSTFLDEPLRSHTARRWTQ